MCDSLHFTVTTRPLGFPGDNLNWSLMLILKWKCTEAEGRKTTTMFYFRDLRFSLTHPHPTLWFLLSSSSEKRRHNLTLDGVFRQKNHHSSTKGQGPDLWDAAARIVLTNVHPKSRGAVEVADCLHAATPQCTLLCLVVSGNIYWPNIRTRAELPV